MCAKHGVPAVPWLREISIRMAQNDHEEISKAKWQTVLLIATMLYACFSLCELHRQGSREREGIPISERLPDRLCTIQCSLTACLSNPFLRTNVWSLTFGPPQQHWSNHLECITGPIYLKGKVLHAHGKVNQSSIWHKYRARVWAVWVE